jgi:hypothetical protein
MATLNSDWIVSRHGPVELVDEGILSVEGTIKMPLGYFPRRMSIVALRGGRTAIWSAIPLQEKSMSRIEELGQPAYLIVPNSHHRLDLRAWKARYPDAKVLAPNGARSSVEQASPVDGNEEALRESGAELIVVEGTGEGEFACKVSRPDGTTLIVNDIIAHVAHPSGLMAKLMARMLGFGARDPQVPRVVRRTLIKDEHALARQLSDWSKDEHLRRIIPSHGDIISNPRETLSKLAQTLR